MQYYNPIFFRNATMNFPGPHVSGNTSLKLRTGQAFGIDGVLKHHRRANSLALRYPACPEGGFNVEKSMIDMAEGDVCRS